MNSSVTLVLLLLLVSAAVALAEVTNVRMFGWSGEGIETDGPPARLSEPVTQQASAADELAKYAALRDQRILTDEEFAAKKAAILGL